MRGRQSALIPDLADGFFKDSQRGLSNRYLKQIIQDQQGDIYELIDSGKMKMDDIAELGEIVNGRPGRISDQQITLHINNGGMGAVDVAIAYLAYERAKEAGRGQHIRLPPVTIKSQSH